MKPVFKSNLFALILILGQVIGSMVIMPFFKALKLNLPQMLVISQIVFLILPSIIYFLITRQSIKSTLRLNKITIKEALNVILLAFLCQPVAWFLSFLSSLFFNNDVAEAFKQMEGLSYPVMLSVMALTPAICEEVTMRGIVISGYNGKSTFKAALMSGLIFGMLHLNAQQFLYAFVLGIIFGYLIRITNSIFSTMLCHFTFNGIQVTIQYLVIRLFGSLSSSANPADISFNEKINTLIGLFFIALIFSALIFIVLRGMKKANSLRGNDGVEIEVKSEEEREYIFNLPFIITVIFYVFIIIKIS